MTPYTRRMIAAGAAALAVAGAGIATHPADARTPRNPQTIAPGGNISSVVNVTARDGWPHAPVPQEMRDVADLALYWGTSGFTRAGSVSCAFGPAMGRARCHGTVGRGRRSRTWSAVVKVWEDGSYRLIIPTN